MDTTDRFSRFAADYHSRSVIQKEVAKSLVSMLPTLKGKRMLDVGCGSGAVWNALSNEQQRDLESFVAIDRSTQMLSLHPAGPKIIKMAIDFNEDAFDKKIKQASDNLVVSASALQWSNNLDLTLKSLANLSDTIYAALFTSATFRTLHRTLGTISPILDETTIIENFRHHYQCDIDKQSYRLYFENALEMLRYIRRTGVSTGKQRASVKAVRSLLKRYPLEYLEFEVLFIKGKRAG